MNRIGIFAIGLVCGAALLALPRIAGHLRHVVRGHGMEATANGRVHTEEKFSFVAQGPMERVMPLFGADKERVWSPGWHPEFVYPSPATDVRGMVFTVTHDHLQSVWVNTELDWKGGRAQYVYLIPDALVTVITLTLKPEGDGTRVEVEYDRTALSPETDSHVRHMAEGDRSSGPDWEKQINAYLSKTEKQRE